MIKLVFCVKRLPSVPERDFYDYWLNQHGTLVKSKAEDLKIRRYVQSHTKHAEFGDAVSAERGMKQPGFDGIAELWWDSIESIQAALSTQAGQAASSLLAEDEARFIDMEASTIFFTEENEVVAFD
ncbi:MAG: EthD domain-containing protein [Halioglobus sp.]|nr:EthD domain-containing protein [Halioglobus sp.]